MSNSISMRGMALSFLDTHELARLYGGIQTTRVTLPRDFMINTLLVREFGQDAYDDHARDLADQYSAYITNLRGSLVSK